MSRLLFAAARGARIEMLQCTGEWVDTDNVPLDPFNTVFMHRRIHPEDEAMQYGPISTALRKDAANMAPKNAVVYDTLCGTWGISIIDWYPFRDCDDELHRSLFLLILAEALADEGL